MAQHHPDRDVAVVFHPACFLKHGHFAGDDRARAEAFVEFANDPRIDAVWFGRGGYGSCRIAEAVLPRLNAVARKKRYLGYSDAGSLLAGMYKAGFKHLAHGPMASDAVRHDAMAEGAIAHSRADIAVAMIQRALVKRGCPVADDKSGDRIGVDGLGYGREQRSEDRNALA